MSWQGVVSTISRIREQSNSYLEDELSRRKIRGILPAHGPVLVILSSEEEPVPVSYLIGKVGRVKSTVSGMVDTLVRHGYVKRSRSDEDRRVIMVSLTPAGRALMPVFREISAGLQDALFGEMPTPERERLASLLEQVEANIRDRDG